MGVICKKIGAGARVACVCLSGHSSERARTMAVESRRVDSAYEVRARTANAVSMELVCARMARPKSLPKHTKQTRQT